MIALAPQPARPRTIRWRARPASARPRRSRTLLYGPVKVVYAAQRPDLRRHRLGPLRRRQRRAEGRRHAGGPRRLRDHAGAAARRAAGRVLREGSGVSQRSGAPPQAEPVYEPTQAGLPKTARLAGRATAPAAPSYLQRDPVAPARAARWQRRRRAAMLAARHVRAGLPRVPGVRRGPAVRALAVRAAADAGLPVADLRDLRRGDAGGRARRRAAPPRDAAPASASSPASRPCSCCSASAPCASGIWCAPGAPSVFGVEFGVGAARGR